MKIPHLFLIIFLITAAGFVFRTFPRQTAQNAPAPTPQQEGKDSESQVTVIAAGLDTPWAIAFLPDNSMLVTERPGRVREIDPGGNLLAEPAAVIEKTRETGEGGLLGITLHPDFSANHFVYVYYTYTDSDDGTLNRVARMTYTDHRLSDETVIVDGIPGASNHNGGRIKFGPDRMLYITTGDAQESSQAQDTDSLAGKILRTTDSGEPVSSESLIYSYGHRNPQGIAWDMEGRLWSTEHGRSGSQSGLDEINLIGEGKNYGWPLIQGDEAGRGMELPKLHSDDDTWAPAGAAVIGQSLFFGGLRGQTLYEAVIDKDEPTLKKHFSGEFGRIREVVAGPDGMLYLSTSNRDGRGNPSEEDDRIMRVKPQR